MALYNACIISKEYIKYQFTSHHILYVIKSFFKNNAPLSKIESTYSDFPCYIKVNRDKLVLINRP